MDYPDYEIIRTKSKWLAFVWMLGDRLYYIGLLGATFIVIAAPVDALFTWLKGSQVGLPLFNLGGLIALVSCLCLFYISQPLKRYARVNAGVRD